jgi:hypothetical protein
MDERYRDSIVRSGDLAYLALTGQKPERFLCLSETFSGGRAPRFAEARLCSAEGLVVPLLVRGRPFRNRSAGLSDGTALSGSVFLTLESSQSPPDQGHPLVLAVGTGGDASVANAMWRSGFPTPSSASAAGLSSDVPMQTPLFVAANERPELSAFLITGTRESTSLYYGEAFQLLSHYGYLCASLERPDRLTLHLDTNPGCCWRLLPFATFYSSFAPDGCLAHAPNPTSLLALSCSASGCTASGRRVYLSRSRCEEEAQDDGHEQPAPGMLPPA